MQSDTLKGYLKAVARLESSSQAAHTGYISHTR